MRSAGWCLLVLTLETPRAWLLHTPPPRPAPRSLPRSRGPVAVAEIAVPGREEAPPPAADDTVGLLLLNLGGPETLDDVEEFLFNLFADPEIITLPSFLSWMNKPLAWLIARGRAPQSREGYEVSFRKWEEYKASGSPLAPASLPAGAPQLATTKAQGEAIVASLNRRGIAAKSYIAMRYWTPYTSEALEALKRDAITKIVVLPLYPQFSIGLSGSSLRELEREFYADQTLRQVSKSVSRSVGQSVSK